MIQIRKLTRDNWQAVLNLPISPQQKKHLSPVTYYIAKAYIMPDDLCVVPFTLYYQDQLAGFFSLEFKSEEYWIRGLRIAITYHNYGLGKWAVQAIAELLQNDYPLCKGFRLDLSLPGDQNLMQDLGPFADNLQKLSTEVWYYQIGEGKSYSLEFDD